ncbi:CoA ester lyase [Qingshengfaniella alkalisoli]|uniref:CoA ester lyase n=2 Tax=Qingshengfaniella alkalisoli TaxID=2599296 RepID=A0A5B8IVP9_9RHOB|nr:CoA ester lyase [Qingshengfaniella alkalisoli]QDY70192.1 CoA ester lyase [Qingshengfaniella alkalisoli]
MQLLRSMLYVPGSRVSAIEKARELPADAVILDLEDAVIPDQKPGARKAVADVLSAGGFGPRAALVRVNAGGTPWHHEDVSMVAVSGAAGVVLPKAEDPSQVEAVAARLDDEMSVWAMIETPRGVLAAERIASTSGVAGLIAGTNDLRLDLQAKVSPDRAALTHALQMIVLAARAAGVAAIDGVFNAPKDAEGLRRECLQGRLFGFDGKTLIHPEQLGIANDVFGPTPDEVSFAARQIEGFTSAQANGQGVAVVDGVIVEELHVRSARQLIVKADLIRDRGW